MNIWHVIVHGAPRTKKTHNQLAWRRSRNTGKRVPVLLPSKQWRRWVKSAVIFRLDDGGTAQLADGRRGRIDLGLAPITSLVRCAALFYRDANRGDLSGYEQGLGDLLEKRGVLKNDRQIVSWDGSQLLKDAAHPRVEIRLEEVAVTMGLVAHG